jgi:hypothetical protein
MKIQCSCGAKYAFDITPEMASQPVSFVCPACGQDSSEIVNQLVREELAAPAAPPPVADAPAPLDASPPSHTVRMRVVLPEKPAAPAPAIPVSSKFCAKHHGERTTETCAICGKPICPKCLALFGYFCSPLCKGKAEAQLIDVPVYAGRKDVADARFWRKTGWVIGATATVMVLALGVWTWYAWFGSVPHSYFSVRFENDRAYSGRSQLVGRDQMVFLHGGTLARYDWKTKKPVWSQELVTKPQIAELVKAHNDLEARLDQEYSGGYRHRQTQDQVEKSAKRMLEAALSLHVSGQNIWVGKAGQLTRYDWDSGKVLREIARPEGGGELVEKDGELLVLAAQSVTHISLASGDTRVESFGAAATAATAVSARNAATGGLPGTVADNGRLLNPQKVEAQAQNLKLPARIALPALLANAAHERQLEAALNGDPQHPRSAQLKSPAADAENFQLISGEKGWVQFSSRLLEEHFVTRSAMKAPPQKSVINGDLNASKSTDAANEILNEMQRNRGGDSVTEDESRYQVTVHLPDSAGTADWTGEVVGPPQLFALKSVNVIVARKVLCHQLPRLPDQVPNPPPDCRNAFRIAPLCCWPSSSPGPRNFKSASAILKPSFVSSRIFSRACASSFGASEIRMQKLSCAPRPMRPRNWCNCASPKCSAFSMSITVAFGTSTPTSMSDVATSAWILFARNPPSPFFPSPPASCARAAADFERRSARCTFSNSFVTALMSLSVSATSTRG